MGKNISAPATRTRWDEQAVTDDLRAELIKTMETAAHEVLTDLREDVLPVFREFARSRPDGRCHLSPTWPESLRTLILHFCRQHNLVGWDSVSRTLKVAAWVVEQIAMTLDFWTAHPEVTEGEHLQWHIRGGYSGMRRTEYFCVELPPRIERSIYESDTDFENRVFPLVNKLVQEQSESLSLRIARLPKVPDKRRTEHFTWVVLHQIRRQSFTTIARQYCVSAASVKNEVNALKKRIGLRLPPGRPGTNSYPRTPLKTG